MVSVSVAHLDNFLMFCKESWFSSFFLWIQSFSNQQVCITGFFQEVFFLASNINAVSKPEFFTNFRLKQRVFF